MLMLERVMENLGQTLRGPNRRFSHARLMQLGEVTPGCDGCSKDGAELSRAF